MLARMREFGGKKFIIFFAGSVLLLFAALSSPNVTS
jgi:hypothetical protein